MDAASAPQALATVVDAHDWEALAALLHPDFTCRLVHTGESFDASGWVRFNADYPGFERFVLLDAVAHGDRAVGRARVTGRDATGEQEYAVAFFLTVRDGLLLEDTEVWTDVAAAPPSR